MNLARCPNGDEVEIIHAVEVESGDALAALEQLVSRSTLATGCAFFTPDRANGGAWSAWPWLGAAVLLIAVVGVAISRRRRRG